DVLVAVAAGGERLRRVVQVESAEGGAETLRRLGRELLVAGRLVDRVTGRERVAGVQADPRALREGEAGADRLQMLQSPADRRTLAGRVFEQDAGAAIGQAGEDLVERCRRAGDPFVVAGA